MNNQNPEVDIEPLDDESMCVIALCGGDAHAAVKALLVASSFLENELLLARACVSRGYSRGRFAQNSNVDAIDMSR